MNNIRQNVNKKKLLIVEDEPEIRELMKNYSPRAVLIL